MKNCWASKCTVNSLYTQIPYGGWHLTFSHHQQSQFAKLMNNYYFIQLYLQNNTLFKMEDIIKVVQ